MLDAAILVVDDEPQVREALCEVLTRAGYRNVKCAVDGDDAIRQIQQRLTSGQGCFDLAIVDWDLGVATALGSTVSDRMLELCQDQQLIIISGHGEADMGGRDVTFIAKPYSPVDLLRVVQEKLFDG